jgi:hypothetical protein
MAQPARNSSDPPPYYYELNEDQKKNWMKNTRRIERNEYLKQKFPPFHTSSNISIIHIHHQTPIDIINELIMKAKEIRKYALDTESQKHKKQEKGALIQIQFIQSINQSTVILIETDHLPDPQSILYRKIKELCSIILNNNNKILTWGTIENEFKDFGHLNLIQIGKIEHINLQSRFREWCNKKTHPAMERRDDEMNDDGKNVHDPTFNDDYLLWSLQNAIAVTFGKFLDKSLTVNFWQCGLDLILNTWKKKILSRRGYNKQEEQQQRLQMIQYAVDDCTSVVELFFHIYPEEAEEQQVLEIPTTTKSTNMILDLENDLSDISEDELIQLLKPKFDKKQATSRQVHDQSGELIITTTQHETNEPSPPEQEPTVLEPAPSTSKQTKKEKQQKKNEKLKWKRKHQPNFQLKIKRPIYHRYDYRKIRAQLLDDYIFTSHHIKINSQHNEVVIGFKSQEEVEHATKIMRINYFSKNQYYDRWGSRN